MREVCLHIGLPKTGSSAIQAFLSDRAADLSRAGIHYAQNKHTATGGDVASSGNGHALVKYLDPRRRRAGFDADLFERVLRKVYFSDRHRLSLISSELLASVDWGLLRQFADRVAVDRSVFVVAVVRNLYDHALSSWNQAVKWHAYSESFDHYVRHDYANPQVGSLVAYGKTFGWSRMRVIRYEEHRANLVPAFLDAIGAPPHPEWRAPRINRSLTAAELLVQRHMNRLYRDPGLSHELAALFIGKRPRARAASPWRPEVARLLKDRFTREVEALSARSGADFGALLEPPSRPRRPPSVVDYAAVALCLPAARKMIRARLNREPG